MYKSLLIFKYLRKRRIAWVSLIGVMLCSAMVLVVISVMSGWLTNFRAKFRGLSGDIVVFRGNVTGFGGYEDMLAEIRKLPEVDQAVPLLHTFGLLNTNNRGVQAVSVTGVDLEQYSKFNQFRESLYNQYQEPVRDGKKPPDIATFNLLNRDYAGIRPGDERATQRPGMIVGAPIYGIKGDAQGKTDVPPWTFDYWCRLEVVPMSGESFKLTDAKPSANIYWVVDISRTKLFQLDDNIVYVPFDVLQKDLQMNAQPYTDIVNGQEVKRVRPSRCSEIQIKLKPGADRMPMVGKINSIVQTISVTADPSVSVLSPVHVDVWENQPGISGFLSAVENEISLMTFLLGLISLVAIFLIFCILYMIVVEKTRDIGIIKSVGATSQGIAVIFLGYGLAIGTFGGLLGLAAGWVIMTWINEIHSCIAWVIGKPIWNPEIYAFDKIPDKVDLNTAVCVLAVAALSAVIGAIVPAIRAARLNPVEALRFE